MRATRNCGMIELLWLTRIYIFDKEEETTDHEFHSVGAKTQDYDFISTINLSYASKNVVPIHYTAAVMIYAIFVERRVAVSWQKMGKSLGRASDPLQNSGKKVRLKHVSLEHL
jgi:hypothetical protein